MNSFRNRFKCFCIRLLNWEYWPSSIIYLPIMPYLAYLMARYRSVFFFGDANPGIEYGGFTMESKWRIQEASNHLHFPNTRLIQKSLPINELVTVAKNFEFPLVVKPDIGGKGRGVIVIRTTEELIWYHGNCPMDYLIQERITYANEAGIFYTRFPGSSEGIITGIVFKTPVVIKGDGKRTVLEILKQDDRYAVHIENITSRIPAEQLNSIPEAGKEILLMDIGNHAQGSAFTDVSKQINQQLTKQIDAIAAQLPGFYFGRIDIRFSSWKELEAGSAFSIIEINGAGSEPTHIYDPAHSILFAWKEIMRHWKILAQISHTNRKLTFSSMRFSDGIALLVRHRKTMKQLDKFNTSLQLVSK